MGAVDDAVAATHAKIKAEADQTTKDKNQGYMIMYIVLVGCALILIGVSIAFTLAITAPMIVLQEDMASVACMDLEKVDLLRPTSGLEEVGSMQKSFLTMVKNLVEYRNYMPASILGSADDEEEEIVEKKVDEGDIKKKKDDASQKSGASSQGSKSKASMSKASMSKGGNSHASSMSRLLAKKAVAASMDVKAKRITIFVSNIKRWHSVSAKQGPNESASIHSQYIKKVLDVVMGPLKGTPDVFLGDRFRATWHTVKPVATHRTNACNAALQCIKACKEILGDNGATLEVAVALSSGEVRCGNMGCDGMKKFTFIGAAASFVHVIERQTRKYGTAILIDGAVEEEARNNFVVRKVDHVLMTRLQDRPLRLFELVAGKAASDDEWMYQLQAGDSGNPYVAYSSAVDLYHKGSHAEGKATLEKCTVKDALFDRLMGLLDAAIASNATGDVELVDVEPKYV